MADERSYEGVGVCRACDSTVRSNLFGPRIEGDLCLNCGKPVYELLREPTEVRWHVVAYDSSLADPEDRVWTVSPDPRETGWETDCGCEGYGLTKADAELLANAANEIDRLREIEEAYENAKSAAYDC